MKDPKHPLLTTLQGNWRFPGTMDLGAWMEMRDQMHGAVWVRGAWVTEDLSPGSHLTYCTAVICKTTAVVFQSKVANPAPARVQLNGEK